MNEAATSAATGQVLRRVARALGDRDGTGPDDTPWLRTQRQEVRAASRRKDTPRDGRRGTTRGGRRGTTKDGRKSEPGS